MLRCLVWGVLFSLWCSSAVALSVRPLSPVELAQLSEQVVIVEVARAVPETTPEGVAVERLTLRVLERWKGVGGATLERRQVLTLRDAPTGAVVEVPGLPRVRAGEVWLMFLPPEGPLPTLGLSVAASAGLFRVRPTAGGARFETADGLPVVRVTAERLWTVSSPPPESVEVVVGERAPPPPPDAHLARDWRAVVEAAK